MSFLYSYILSNLSEILKYSINFLILINKSSAVADMGDRGHNRRGPKEGAVVPSALLRGRAVPAQHNVAWVKLYFRTKWLLHPSTCLATIDMGRKLRGHAPFVGGGEPGSQSNSVA